MFLPGGQATQILIHINTRYKDIQTSKNHLSREVNQILTQFYADLIFFLTMDFLIQTFILTLDDFY